jgi:hypothetical protein
LVSERDETRSRFDEWLSGETGGFGVEHGLVQLPVREAPLPVLPPTSEWVNADLFAEKGEGFDYSLAIQRAIDSGARVVYIPAGGAVKSTIEIRGNLEWIMGFGNLLWWSGPQNEKERFPLFRVGPGARPVVVFDHVGANQYSKLGWMVEHAAPTTVVMRHLTGFYRNTVPGGTVFMEDWYGPSAEFNGQTLYGRQVNPEGKTSPLLLLNNSTAWLFGFKTEYGSVALRAINNSRVEVLGGYHYHKGEDLYQIADSLFSVVFPVAIPGYQTLLRYSQQGREQVHGNAYRSALIGRP